MCPDADDHPHAHTWNYQREMKGSVSRQAVVLALSRSLQEAVLAQGNTIIEERQPGAVLALDTPIAAKTSCNCQTADLLDLKAPNSRNLL